MDVDYAIVEFCGEEAVDIVPESWLERTREAMFTYWPEGHSSMIKQKVKKKEIPDKVNWPKFEVRVFSYADTYEKAVRRAKRAAETSNVDTNEEDEEVDKRREARKPSRYSSSEDEESREPAQKRKKSITPQQPSTSGGQSQTMNICVPTPPQYLTSPHNRHRANSPSRQPRVLPDLPDWETPRRGGGKEDNFERKVLMALARLEKQMEETTQVVKQLRAGQFGSIQECVDLDTFVPQPLVSIDQIMDLNNKLLEDNQKKQMTLALSILGGNSLGDTVRKMLRRLGTNQLWSLYSLKGRKEKLPFQDTQVYKIIVKASLKVHMKGTESEVNDANMLPTSKEAINIRNHSPPLLRNKTETETEVSL